MADSVERSKSPRELMWEAIEHYADLRSACASRGATQGTAKVLDVELAAEAVDRAVDRMPVVRKRLPTCRKSQRLEFRIGGFQGTDGYKGGVKLYVQLGFYPDGRVGELFLDTSKEGSDLRHFMNAFAMAISLLLQVGAPVSLVAHTLEKRSGGPCGSVDSDTTVGIDQASSMVDLVSQILKQFDIGGSSGQ